MVGIAVNVDEILYLTIKTAGTAGAGLLCGIIIAVLCTLLSHVLPRCRPLLAALSLLAYSLPPFAAVHVGLVMQVEDELRWLMVAAAVALPLYLGLQSGAHLADSHLRLQPCGIGSRRFWHVVFPCAAPTAMATIGTCIPWALLSAMLGEMALGGQGLGIAIVHSTHRGWEAAAPYVAAACFASIAPYALLNFCAAALSGHLSLRHTALEGDIGNAEYNGSRPAVRVTILLGLFAALWWLLYQRAPGFIPHIMSILTATGRLAELPTAAAETWITTALALALGCLSGIALALTAHAIPLMRSVATALLLPLQILPIIAFVPFLMGIRGFGVELASGISGPVLVWVASIFPTLLVAALACAYAAYRLCSVRLGSLSVYLGPMVSARPRSDWAVLRHVTLPWALRSVPATLDSATSRTLLAVIVCEYLVSASGLGGLISDLRGQRAFLETWSAVFLLVATAGLINALAHQYWQNASRLSWLKN